MTSKRSASGEYAIDRVGVSWRKNTSTGNPTTCVVEMRLPKSGWRLHFGSYATEPEAMIARDYAAFLRDSAGEKGTSAGGFYADDHPSIYEFEESPVVFERIDISKVRRDEYKRLHTLYEPKEQPQPGGKAKSGGNSPYRELCSEARNDITVAIGEFHKRYPFRLLKCRTATEAAKDSQKVDRSVVGGMDLTPPSPNFEVGSSQSSQSSMMADNKQKEHILWLDQNMPRGDESPKKKFPSGIRTSNHLLSSPGGKSSQDKRGFNTNNGDSMFDGSLDGGMHLTSALSNFEVGSSQSSQCSMMADDNHKGRSAELDQIMSGVDEYPKETFSSSIGTLNHLSSSPGDESIRVTRGFNANQETSPWIKAESKHKIKEDSKSLLQVQLANYNFLGPCHEGFKLQDDGVSMAGFSSSPHGSYESYNTQLASYEGVVTPNCDQKMSPTSITYSGVPGSLSAGTSVEDETGLSSNNRDNFRQGMSQIEEKFAEEEFVHLHLANSFHVGTGEVSDHNRNFVWECHIGNDDENVMPDKDDWMNDVIIEEWLEDQPAMDIDETANLDIPLESDDVPESNGAPSHMLATTPNSTSEVERVMSKVEVMEKVVCKAGSKKTMSKAAVNKVMSKAEMVEKRFKSNTLVAKGCSASSAHREAMLATRLEAEKVKLDTVVQQNNSVKIANLRTAKDDGVISDEQVKEEVKALLNL